MVLSLKVMIFYNWCSQNVQKMTYSMGHIVCVHNLCYITA